VLQERERANSVITIHACVVRASYKAEIIYDLKRGWSSQLRVMVVEGRSNRISNKGGYEREGLGSRVGGVGSQARVVTSEKGWG